MENQDIYSTNEFKRSLKNFEDVIKTDDIFYFDSEELRDIVEYYKSITDLKMAKKAALYTLKLYPGLAWATTFCARLLNYDGKHKAAAEMLEATEDKTNFEYYIAKAEFMIEKNNINEVNKYLEEKLDLLSGYDKEDFIIDAVSMFIDYDYCDIASEWLKKATLKDELYDELAAILEMQKGNFEKSKSMFNKLVEEHPYDSSYWNKLASSQYFLNDISGSMQSSEFAIAINPNDPEAIKNHSIAMTELGNYEDSINGYKKVLKLSPDDGAAMAMLGLTYMKNHDIPESIHWLTKAEQMLQGEPLILNDVYNALAQAYSFSKNYDMAHHYLDKLESLQMTDEFDLLLIKAQTALDNDKDDEAERYISEARKVEGLTSDDEFRIAVMYYVSGKYSEAIECFDKIFKAEGKKWRKGYAYYAACCLGMGDKDRYQEMLRLARKICPNEVEYVMGKKYLHDNY